MTNLQELITGTATADAITNYSVTTNLVPNDVVVVCCSKGAGSPDTVVTTTGLTYTEIFDTFANTRAQAHWTTGATGPINIAVRVHNFEPSRVVIYVIRGLASPVLYGVRLSQWGNNGGDDLSAPQIFREGQFAIAEAISSNPATAVFPTTAFSTPPDGGWIMDDLYTGAPDLRTAHAIGQPGEMTTLTAGISNGANYNGVTTMVFGTPLASAGSVYVEEINYTQLSTNVAKNIVLKTALVPTDLVVVIGTQYLYADSGATPTGLTGGTWTKAIDMQPTSPRNSMGFVVWTKKGVTGAGTITLTGYQYFDGRALVYVIRGFSDPVIGAWVEGSSVGDLPIGAQLGPSDLVVTAPAIAFLEGRWRGTAGRLIAPSSNTLPAAAGWNKDHTTLEEDDLDVRLTSSTFTVETGTTVRGRVQGPSPAGPATTMVFVVGNAVVAPASDNGRWGVQI